MTNNRTDLEALAARCEAAESDGEMFAIDCEIERLIFDRQQGMIRRFTDSIDAALQLVPEGMAWTVSDPANSDGARSVFGHPSRCRATVEGSPNQFDYARTPALAMCAASLRARAALTKAIASEVGK
jgi:hypothetical protein